MQTVSVGEAIGSGFRLITTKPAAVAIWCLFLLIAVLGPVALIFGWLFGTMGDVFAAARPGGQPSPAQSARIIQSMMGFQLISLPVNVITFVGTIVLITAIFRAVLEPLKSSYGYLRLGMQEFWVGAVVLVQAILFGFGAVFAALPFIIVVSIVGFATKSVPLTVSLGVLSGLIWFVGLIYLAIRFSMGAPMSFHQREFRLFESWNLTKGHTGSLLLVALAVVGVILLLELLVGAVFAALGVAAFMGLMGGPAGAQAFFRQPPSELLAALGPVLIVAVVLWSIVAAVFSVVATAPWANVYRQLTPVDVEATFS